MATTKGETAAVSQEAAEAERERLVRKRRNEETRKELQEIQEMKKVGLLLRYSTSKVASSASSWRGKYT